MGFFSKLKKTENPSGVKVSVEASDPIRLTDADIPVHATVVNTTDKPARINSITIRLYYDENRDDGTISGSRDVSSMQAVEVAFTLEAAETKSYDVSLPLGAQPAAQTTGALSEPLAKAVSSILSPATGTNKRNYHLNVLVDVDGISLDPSATKDMHVLSHGEAGKGSFKISF